MAKEKNVKDPNVVLGLGILGTLFLGAFPALGHVYLGKARRGIVWNVIYWIVSAIILLLGSVCCIVWLIIPLFAIVIVADSYKMAKGEKEMLPKVLE